MSINLYKSNIPHMLIIWDNIGSIIPLIAVISRPSSVIFLQVTETFIARYALVNIKAGDSPWGEVTYLAVNTKIQVIFG